MVEMDKSEFVIKQMSVSARMHEAHGTLIDVFFLHLVILCSESGCAIDRLHGTHSKLENGGVN